VSKPRRDFFKELLAIGALQGFAASPAVARTVSAFLDQSDTQNLNPDFDSKASNFWSGFLSSDAEPIIQSTGQTRGGGAAPGSDLQPVFLHYSSDGFKNAAELDTEKLISEGDVAVSLNTSTLRLAPDDLATFDRLQNAQIRVDVVQRTAILPVIEAMAYTVVSGMLSVKAEMKPKKSSGGSTPKSSSSGKPSSVQSISVDSDPTWQKMQNIILPGGEGRWALNLEAQKKDSLFCKVLQNVVKEGGQFAPMIGLPGIFLSALQSFNILYGAIHAEPVQVIKSNPLRVFATQEAIQKTGSPGSVTGIMLKSGTYVLIPAKQAPALDQFKNLAVIQGRVVPPKTTVVELDEAAADTLKDVTYVTFDVQVQPTTLFPTKSSAKSS
jgi:hypothetical protein